MQHYSLWLLLSLQAFLLTVRGQLFAPDPHWLNPDGSKADFSDTFQVHDTVRIAWLALNQSTGDLWLTHFNATISNYNVSLTKGVDLSVDGTFMWTVNIPPEEIAISNQFVLRFYPAGSLYYILQFKQAISPGFLVADNSSVATTTSSSTTTSATTSATVSTSPTSTAANSTANASTLSSSSGGLSNGAKAGIAVGCVVGVLALLAVGWFLGRRYRRDRVGYEPGGSGVYQHSEGRMSQAPAPPYAPETPPKKDGPLMEMAADQRLPGEVTGHGVQVKPGLHEL